MILNFLILLGLVLLSSFFSAAEIAFFSLSRARVRSLRNQGLSGIVQVERLKKYPQELLITLLIGNNVANILAAVLASRFAEAAFGSVGVGIAAGVMTFVILLFGEIIPKAYATANAQTIALGVAPIIRTVQLLLWPFVRLFALCARWITRRSKTKEILYEEEIKAAAMLGHEAGVVEQDEREMIDRIFKLNDKKIEGIMTPLNKVDVIPLTSTLKEALAIFRNTGFSRLPVYKKDTQRIVGVLYVKSLINALGLEKEVTMKSIMIRPLFCSPSDRVDHLLQKFQLHKNHLAVVHDSKRGTIGIVTLEDVLEEIVGEIYDETDIVGRQAVK